MFSYEVNGCLITSNEELTDTLAVAYWEHSTKKYECNISHINLVFDGDEVDIDCYKYEPVKFDRIRRITGYLVGTLDRFNDAKRAEESERVKHNVSN